MVKKSFFISKERLLYLYKNKKLSVFKIAEIFNCTAGTIINRMKGYNIKRRYSGPKRINISRDALYLLYIKKRLSASKIAKICHCEQTAILNRLKKYNIPLENAKKKIDILKKDLYKLYKKRGLSAYKIAKIFNCYSSTVYRYLKVYKIETRPLKKIDIPVNSLKNFYFNKKLSLKKIANIYDCDPVSVWKKMKKFGFLLRNTSEACTIHKKKNFQVDLNKKSYMIGFRLGDLRIRKNHNLIGIGCGTTKKAQVLLIKKVFGGYGPIWISKRDKRGVVHVECSLNSSFRFLLPKHKLIPKWILNNKKHFLNFLAGYTDAEGNIAISQGRARFRIRTYDKRILSDINDKLNKMGIRSLFRLDKKAGIDNRGILRREDTWAVIINEKKSLLRIFKFLKLLLKHKKRKNDLAKSLKNVIIRLNS